MDLTEFINENDVEYTDKTVSEEVIQLAENEIGINFGIQLKEYIMRYGYLAFEYVEFYGMNSNENMESDMVKQSIYLHKYFPETGKYIAFENRGEGDYYIVDSEDEVFEFDSNVRELCNTGLKLLVYILKRFEDVK